MLWQREMGNVMLWLAAGSSSLKFAVHEVAERPAGLSRLGHGQVEKLRAKPRFQAFDGDGRQLDDGTMLPNAEYATTNDEALGRLLSWLQAHRDGSHCLMAAGHRVAHSGTDSTAPVRIDTAVLDRLDPFSVIAPLHQPTALSAIGALQARQPHLPQVACFDTSFHPTQPEVSQAFALPRA